MKKIIDLTAPMTDGDPTMPMDPKLSISWHCTLSTLGYNLSRVIMSTHQGTHIDAPRHFFNNGMCVDQLELSRCIVTAIKVDMTHKESDTPILPSDMKPYEERITSGCAVLIRTGWDRYFPGPEFFAGFPYVSKELADWFVERKVGLVGMDLPTPNGIDWKYVHVKMLGAGILIVEGLVNMDALPDDRAFTFLALPLKLKGRDGSPVRAVALLD
ncbi:MAG: cyclase family protein [Dysgonamonadaceae bacterium]|jgi:kynurenine formamidase|nr:cyclase family protein [Dysgonamonadaceae bacterium]